MVWVPLANSSGQVVKGIRLKDPDGHIYEVMYNKRLGINRYQITMKAEDESIREVTNADIRKTTNKVGWEIVGRWHTPQELAKMFNKPVDVDANEPRPRRLAFWKMASKPGTHNYKQKKRLMTDPYYIERFGHLFETTIIEK